MPILRALRVNPIATITNHDIYVDVKLMGTRPGGPIIITENDYTIYSYFMIQSAQNGTDYYYPFIPRNVGDIRNVNPIDGTVVVTAGMNGCALEVRHSNNGYHFYHDADGKYMSTVCNPGTRVCRIEASAYWDDRFMISYKAMQFAQPAICFICVYKNGLWHVGAFGFRFKFNPNGEDTINSCFVPKNGKYRGYFNDTICLIQR